MYLNSTNSTPVQPTPLWTFSPIYSVVMGILTLTNNGTILLVFLRNRNLRSNAFCCYLINLLLANLFHAIAHKPLEVIFLLYPNTEHTASFCSGFISTVYLSNAIMMQSHVLISTNRVWAVSFPFTYQTHHSIKTAIALCIAAWIFVFIVLLPGLLVDRIRTRESGDNVNCLLNTDGYNAFDNWNKAIQAVLYTVPLIVIVSAYPLICWQRRHRMGGRILVASNAVAVAPLPAAVLAESLTFAVHPEQRKPSRAFSVLTLLTVAVLVCWTPMMSSYCLALYGHTYIPQLFEAGQILWAVEPVLDPILFSIAVNDLRATIRRMLST